MVTQTAAAVKTLTIGTMTFPVATWRRAYERAIAEGIRVFQCNGHWFATSATQPGVLHHVNGTCDCEGATYGRLCKHVAATIAERIRQGELARCATCGRVAARSEMAAEYRHVGGQDDRREFYCAGEHIR